MWLDLEVRIKELLRCQWMPLAAEAATAEVTTRRHKVLAALPTIKPVSRHIFLFILLTSEAQVLFGLVILVVERNRIPCYINTCTQNFQASLTHTCACTHRPTLMYILCTHIHWGESSLTLIFPRYLCCGPPQLPAVVTTIPFVIWTFWNAVAQVSYVCMYVYMYVLPACLYVWYSNDFLLRFAQLLSEPF